MENTIYIVETPDGDVWRYDNLDEAQRAIYIFGRAITRHDPETVPDRAAAP